MNKSIYLIIFSLLLVGTALVMRRLHKPSYNKQATERLYSYLTNDSNTNEVAFWLRQGANPNFQPRWPNKGTTPLHVAALSRAFEIAKVLVVAGATNGTKAAAIRQRIS